MVVSNVPSLACRLLSNLLPLTKPRWPSVKVKLGDCEESYCTVSPILNSIGDGFSAKTFGKSLLHSLKKQPTFRDATTSFLAKWRLRNECTTSILMTRHYPDLSGWSKFPTRHDQSEAQPRSGSWRVKSTEFLRRHFAEKPVVASQNDGWFLRLPTGLDGQFWLLESALKQYRVSHDVTAAI